MKSFIVILLVSVLLLGGCVDSIHQCDQYKDTCQWYKCKSQLDTFTSSLKWKQFDATTYTNCLLEEQAKKCEATRCRADANQD